MSTTLAPPAETPVSLRHADTPERWEAALKRAHAAGVKVYELGQGRYVVTSAHDPAKAYEVTIQPETCTCQAGTSGDPVCLHRAAVRDHLAPPRPPCSICHGTGRDYMSVWDWRNGRAATLYDVPCECTQRKPDPEPPTPSAYDPNAEALRWAYNDRDRAHRDLDRYNAKIAQHGSLNERDYRGFLDAQQREQDASLRIAELTSTMKARAAA